MKEAQAMYMNIRESKKNFYFLDSIRYLIAFQMCNYILHLWVMIILF